MSPHSFHPLTLQPLATPVPSSYLRSHSMSHPCHHWNKSAQAEALSPNASKALVPGHRSGLSSVLLRTGRDKTSLLSSVLAFPRLGAQVRLLWGPVMCLS